MFVVAATFVNGFFELVAIDFLILVVLSQLLHQVTHDDNAMEGESFLNTVLESEQHIADQKVLREKRKVGSFIRKYLNYGAE